MRFGLAGPSAAPLPDLPALAPEQAIRRRSGERFWRPYFQPGSVSYWGKWSVIVNHGALEPTKMCLVGRIDGSSTRVPMVTWTNLPSRTTE